LVRGPFLDAFYLPGAAPFERWIEEERQRLTASTIAALLALASEAGRANHLDAAVMWWQRLTAIDPLSGRFALGYLKALAARGDRAEALAFARQHETLMRRELDTDPDPDIRRVEAELRAMRTPPAFVPQVAGAETRPPAVPDDTSAVIASQASSPPSPGRRPRRDTFVGRPAALIAFTALIALAGVAFARARGWLGGDVRAMPTLAVGFIRDEGVPDSVQVGRIITDMLATNLSRIEGLRVLANSRLLELVDPRQDAAAAYASAARRSGASELFEGQLTLPAREGLTLELRRVDLESGIVREVYRISAEDRFLLVDSLTAVIARDFRLRPPASSVADATTSSALAYRLYEEGLRAYHQSDPRAAQRLMRAALQEDSTFAMAAYYEAELAGPEDRTPDGRHLTAARETALRLARRAPDRERLTITANVLAADQDPGSIIVAESLATRYPDDPRASMTLARVRLALGDYAGAVRANEHAISVDSIAETPGSSTCRLCSDLAHLIDIYFWWDSLPAAQRTAQRLLRVLPASAEAMRTLALASARLGDSASAYGYFRRLSALGATDRAWRLHLDLTLENYDLVERNVQQLLASSSASEVGMGMWLYSIALRNQGRLREATMFNQTGTLPGLLVPAVGHEPGLFITPILAFERGDFREAARGFDRLWDSDTMPRSQGVKARRQAWRGTLSGMALAASGDTMAVRALVDSVERWGRGSAFGRDRRAHHFLRGLLYTASSRHEDAVREFREAIHSPSLGFTRVNYEMARCLLRLDRPREAVAVLQPALRGEIDASNLYVTRTELHELLADAFERAGQQDSAAVHYRAVVKAWQRADPEFHARRERAAAAMNRLGIASR
jgi:DNA-binding SARP family transcriptional activator